MVGSCFFQSRLSACCSLYLYLGISQQFGGDQKVCGIVIHDKDLGLGCFEDLMVIGALTPAVLAGFIFTYGLLIGYLLLQRKYKGGTLCIDTVY